MTEKSNRQFKFQHDFCGEEFDTADLVFEHMRDCWSSNVGSEIDLTSVHLVPQFNDCQHCYGVHKATGREIEVECPGHRSAIDIAGLSKIRVFGVDVSMVLHISQMPVKVISERTGLSTKEIASIMSASAEWHAAHAND